MRHTTWTPGDILACSGAYWESAALQSGVSLDLFTVLAEKPQSVPDLAAALSCDARALDMLCSALTAMGLLIRDGALLRTTNESSRHLSRDSPHYLGFIILHHAELMPSWAQLTQAVKTGLPTRPASIVSTDDPEERKNFLLGMFNVAVQQAGAIAAALDFSHARRLLDLGGGPGTYAVYFCQANPELRAVVFDLPGTQPFAEQIIRRHGLEERISFAAGDFDRDPLPEGCDVVWLSQILHGCPGPEAASNLTRRAASALAPGGRLFIQDFVLSDTRDGPVHPALFGLNMLVGTEKGQVYTERELRDMLAQAGLEQTRTHDVPLPNGCRVISGVKAA